MRIGSLFSGIGGLELGLEWAGVGHTAWQVEREPFCRAVLAKHWPNAERFDDVNTVGAHNLAPVEVICGGFPCQDISFAGKGAGLAGERSGLWFEYARIVRELRPRFVVVENVAALLARGLDAVLGTLASLGYDAEWSSLRASDVGARHRRDRLFIVAWLADSHGARLEERRGERGDAQSERSATERGGAGERAGFPNSDGWRLESVSQLDGHAAQDPANRNSCGRHANGCGGTEGGRTQPRMGRMPDGVRSWLDVAGPGLPQHPWEPPRVSSKAEHRAARLKALGNAVVPQAAEVVGQRLMEIARAREAA